MRWTLRRTRRWLPEQWAVIPALWLIFGALPFILFTTLGPFGVSGPGPHARRPGPVVPTAAAALVQSAPVDRLHDLWPDPYAPVYYPSAGLSVEFHGGNVSRVGPVSQ